MRPSFPNNLRVSPAARRQSSIPDANSDATRDEACACRQQQRRAGECHAHGRAWRLRGGRDADHRRALSCEAFTVGATDLQIQIWDTAVQERSRGLVPRHFRDAQASP
jgi:hypothetical protein